MAETVQMGNDEFILYIRKRHPSCRTSNKTLGKKIWGWVRDHDPSARKLGKAHERCLWGADGKFVNKKKGLPGSARQLEFARSLLPALYTFLDELGTS